MAKQVTILTGPPAVVPIATMKLLPIGIEQMMEWVGSHRPECLPDEADNWQALFPHNLEEPTENANESQVLQKRPLTDNELLVELAGRKCYDSFGLKAGKRTNREYIANLHGGTVPHKSVFYHAKMSFFIAGVSRRVSHELIRNYVGADREEEGNPSQESTRFTHHYGFFIAPPRYLDKRPALLKHFQTSMQSAYDNYLYAVEEDCAEYRLANGKDPTGMDKKRIYEASSSFLPHQSETSFIWTTNPEAIAKFVRERADNASDLEIQRLARTWAKVCMNTWPNLFPQPWMKEAAST